MIHTRRSSLIDSNYILKLDNILFSNLRLLTNKKDSIDCCGRNSQAIIIHLTSVAEYRQCPAGNTNFAAPLTPTQQNSIRSEQATLPRAPFYLSGRSREACVSSSMGIKLPNYLVNFSCQISEICILNG